MFRSPFDEVKLPEGYLLRHFEKPNGPPYRAITLYRKDDTPIAHLEQETDLMRGELVFAVVFPAGGKRPVPHKMRGYDLTELFVRACAYDRVTQ